MKKTVTLKQVLAAMKTIRDIERQKCTPMFAYGINKNKAKMKPDIEGIVVMEAPIHEAEKKRAAYCEKSCTKDDKGNAIVVDGNYQGVNVETEEYKSIMADLQREITEQEKRLSETTTEIDFHMIPFEELPGAITPVELENLSIMINEPKA